MPFSAVDFAHSVCECLIRADVKLAAELKLEVFVFSFWPDLNTGLLPSLAMRRTLGFLCGWTETTYFEGSLSSCFGLLLSAISVLRCFEKKKQKKQIVPRGKMSSLKPHYNHPLTKRPVMQQFYIETSTSRIQLDT